eukprot:1534193-Ditylum_brightwellii.AAC.1
MGDAKLISLRFLVVLDVVTVDALLLTEASNFVLFNNVATIDYFFCGSCAGTVPEVVGAVHLIPVSALELYDSNTTALEANSNWVEKMDNISLTSLPGTEASKLHQTKGTYVFISGGGNQCMAKYEDLGLNGNNSDRDTLL